jgi:hypothetical protein
MNSIQQWPCQREPSEILAVTCLFHVAQLKLLLAYSPLCLNKGHSGSDVAWENECLTFKPKKSGSSSDPEVSAYLWLRRSTIAQLLGYQAFSDDPEMPGFGRPR